MAITPLFSYAFSQVAGQESLVSCTNLSDAPSGSTFAWTVYDSNGVLRGGGAGGFYNVMFKDISGVATGLYEIKLTVTKDSSSATSSVQIYYDNTIYVASPFISIWKQVKALSGDTITVSSDQFTTFRDNWQELLASALAIPYIYIHDETRWPAIANALIGHLIVRDVIMAEANSSIASSQTGSGGEIKRIETGPVNTEWFPTGSSLKTVFSTDGLWDNLNGAICRLSGMLAVYIDGCPQPSGVVAVPSVFYCGDYSYEEQYLIAPQFKNKI